VAVYGAAQPKFKESFLTELVQSCRNEKLPLCIGRDFNIIGSSKEKSNDRFEERWPFLFNAVIDSMDLREIEMSGRKYTWANSRKIPTYEKLDRVLISTEWEQNFPLATVDALSREISDHTPLLLSTGKSLRIRANHLLNLSLVVFLKMAFPIWWQKCGIRKRKEYLLYKNGKIRLED
jgi:hypothetical protein